MFNLYNPINFKRLPYVLSNIMVQFLTYVLIINLSLNILPIEIINVPLTIASQIYFIYLAKIKHMKYNHLQDIKRNKSMSEEYFNNTFGIFIGQFYMLYLILFGTSSIVIDFSSIDFWLVIAMPIAVILLYISTLRTTLLICNGSNQIIFNNEMKRIVESNCSKHIDCPLTSIYFSHPLDLDLNYNEETGFYWKNIKMYFREDENEELIEGIKLNVELDLTENDTIIKAVTYERIVPANKKEYLVTNYSLYNYRSNPDIEMGRYGNIVGPKDLLDSWLFNYDRTENEQRNLSKFLKEIEASGIKIDMSLLTNMFRNCIYSTRIFYFTSSILSYKRLVSLDSNYVDKVNRFNSNITNLLTYEEFDSFRRNFLDGLLGTMYGTSDEQQILKLKSNKTSGREGELTRYKKLFVNNDLTVLSIDRVNENFKITE